MTLKDVNYKEFIENVRRLVFTECRMLKMDRSKLLK